MRTHGIVHLVGAGPGDPDLITVKGLRRLGQADVVVHDRLVSPRLLDAVPASARRIDVGKAPDDHPWPQSRINALLIAEARRRRRVVRLKGGDPFVFGRGGEECEALAAAGIPYEVVPGVTSAVAVPAFAGIPVTHREYSSAFTVMTGHMCERSSSSLDWSWLARGRTLVVLMGLGQLTKIVTRLVAHGRPPETPVAVVACGTAAEQTVVRGTLGNIVAGTRGMRTPATIVIGEVAALCDRLAWFDPAGGETCGFSGIADAASRAPAEQRDVVA